ncbi:MAG: FAD:protein FMN transferase [Prosthecobacter sp.]|nr:FAD:protein FMN transferase [Prosthecobacter sp.]
MLRKLGCLLLLLCAACTPEPHLTALTGPTMGTTWTLQAVNPPTDLQAFIQSHLDSGEAVLSHWRPDSALSRFNASASTDWFAVPPQLVRAVKLAREIADQTDGALDITLAPVIDLWGFGASPANHRVPSDEEIAQALTHCGWRHLQWRDDPPALRKTIPTLRINVASVTEGLVMDELVPLLKQRDLANFLLELGGEVAAIGHAPDGQPWQVGIQTPDASQGQVMQTLPLTDQCLATSGSYRHRFEVAGVNYSHIIDPRTGRPITHNLLSVSVIDPQCTRADGYATALTVLGPERGRVAAQKIGLRVFWIESPLTK